MSLRFQRPIGAVADFKELEYVAALHQTCNNTDEDFKNGSIDATDIKNYLMSRHGVDVSLEYVRSTILVGLGGGDSEEDCLDICEITAVLIIPLVVEAVKQKDGAENSPRKTRKDFVTSWGYNDYLNDQEELAMLKPSPTMIADVLRIILIDVTGSSDPPPLTKKLVQSIFATYDEYSLVENETLLDEMIQVASGGKAGAKLDVEAFSRALTEDVDEYDPTLEQTYSTLFEDALGQVKRDSFPQADLLTKQEESSVEGNEKKPLDGPRFSNTLPPIDLTAENFRSTPHLIAILISIPIAYFNFMGPSTALDPAPKFDGTIFVCDPDSFGCQLVTTVWDWVYVMLRLCFLGTFYIFLLGVGNENSASALRSCAGILMTSLLIFVPNFVQFDWYIISTYRDYNAIQNHLTRWIHVFLGIIICMNQCLNLVRVFVPENFKKNKKLSTLLMGSNIVSEYQVKQSGSIKVNKMIKNAYKLHEERVLTEKQQSIRDHLSEETKKDREESSNARALLNFTDQQDESEEIGGFMWAWKNYIGGDLGDREGIWINSRIIAALLAQCFTTTVFLVMFLTYGTSVVDGVYPKTATPAQECDASFDYGNCYFPQVAVSDASENPFNTTTKNVSLGFGVCKDIQFRKSTGCNLAPLPDFLQEYTQQMCDYVFDMNKYLSQAEGQLSSQASDALQSEVDNTLSTAENVLSGFKNVTNELNNMTGGAVPDVDISIQDITDGVSNATNIYNDLTGENIPDVEDVLGMIEDPTTLLDFELESCPVFNTTSSWAYEAQSIWNQAFLDRLAANDTEAYYELCLTEIAVCTLTAETEDFFYGSCVVGMGPSSKFLPGSWIGNACTNYPTIAAMPVTLQDFKDSLPYKWVLELSLGVGVCGLIIAMFFNISIVIPSTITTIFKFRYGLLPTLHASDFNKYRSKMEDFTFIIGIMFWCSFFSAAFMFVITAGITFLVTYHVTLPYVINFASLIIGITVTLVFKMVLLFFLGKYGYAGFYRKRVAISNLANLALEAWHLALTIGFMVSRIAKVLVTCVLFVGRIDTPILAEGGIGDKLDKYPLVFRKQILATEAHRHPYIERLGMIYLMNLRQGDDFCRKSGSTWRLLFVFALMPWLRRTRITDDEDEVDPLVAKLAIKKVD